MTDERVLDFFSQAGEVMYVRMAEPEKHSKKDKEAIPTRGAYVEFKCLSALKKALALTGSEVDNCKIKVHHSTSAITKPLYRDEEEAEEKIKSAVDLYKLAYNIVTDALASGGRSSRHSPSPLRIRTRRSRSRELSLKGVRSPRRSPTRHLSPYRRSRSPHYSSGRRYRSRSRSPYYRHRSHSRSRSHKRSHHRSNKRSRSRKRSASTKHKHRSSRSHRSRSRSKKRKHRSRSRSKKRKHRSRDRSKKKSQGSKVKLQYDDAEVNGKDINESSNEALSDQDESVAT